MIHRCPRNVRRKWNEKTKEKKNCCRQKENRLKRFPNANLWHKQNATFLKHFFANVIKLSQSARENERERERNLLQMACVFSFQFLLLFLSFSLLLIHNVHISPPNAVESHIHWLILYSQWSLDLTTECTFIIFKVSCQRAGVAKGNAFSSSTKINSFINSNSLRS